MASGFYTSFFGELAKGTHDFENDTFKLALLDNSHSFDRADDVWTDISANEVSGSGYTAGGKAVTSVTVTVDDTDLQVEIDFDDVDWANSSIKAYHAVLYNDDKDDKLVLSEDFGGEQRSISGTFKYQLPSGGVILGTEA